MPAGEGGSAAAICFETKRLTACRRVTLLGFYLLAHGHLRSGVRFPAPVPFLGGTVPGGTVRRGARDANGRPSGARPIGRAGPRLAIARRLGRCRSAPPFRRPEARRLLPPDWWVASLPAGRAASGVYMAEWCAPDGGFEPPWACTRRSLRPLSFHLDKSGAGSAHCRRTCLPGVFCAIK